MEIGLRAPGHAHLWVVLWSTRRMGRSSTTVPNLKRTALFVQKLYGSQHFETESRGGRFMVHTQQRSVFCACTKFQADSSIRSKVIRCPKISKLGHVTLSHAPFETQTLNLCRNPSRHTCCQILCF